MSESSSPLEQTCHYALKECKELYKSKFASERTIFSKIQPSDRIYIGTGCGEPQYLLKALTNYVEKNPKAIFDAEVFHVWTVGSAPYLDKEYKHNFRHTSFFVSDRSRDSVNQGVADYIPISMSEIPNLFYNKQIPIDVALIQTTPPDKHGYMSLGISVDMTKAAVETASLTIAQINFHMPRVLGDSFIHINDVDYLIHHDEPLLEFEKPMPSEVAQKIGKYVARIIEDGDTLQVGYGSTPNAILPFLHYKKHLGIHTEIITDGIVELMKAGVIDNTKKTLNPSKTVAAFCLGRRETYEFLHDNPSVDFRRIDYTNNRIFIATQKHMVAINSALQIDLTGQSSAESVGVNLYSGIGGHSDFMRGAMMAPGGKSILLIQSLTPDSNMSRIVPVLDEGTGTTLNRSDVHYVVTEYGIAYLHGKSIRERAMDLISIAHPKWRSWLIEEAKRYGYIYRDQAFIPGKRGEYPEELETYRTIKGGRKVLLRPVKISDEPKLKEFFYSLSDQTMKRRFISSKKNMPHEKLQEFVIIDYTKEMVILAIIEVDQELTTKEDIVALGQYNVDEATHTAEVAFIVRDDFQGLGIGSELMKYLTLLAKKQGLLGFTAEVMAENRPMIKVFEKMGFDMQKNLEEDVYDIKMGFKER